MRPSNSQPPTAYNDGDNLDSLEDYPKDLEAELEDHECDTFISRVEYLVSAAPSTAGIKDMHCALCTLWHARRCSAPAGMSMWEVRQEHRQAEHECLVPLDPRYLRKLVAMVVPENLTPEEAELKGVTPGRDDLLP